MIQMSLRIKLPASRVQEVLRVLRSVAGPTEVQTGCLGCHIYQDVLDESIVGYVEQWQSQADLERHIKSDHFWRLLATIDLATESPELNFHEVTHTWGMEYVAAVRGLEI